MFIGMEIASSFAVEGLDVVWVVLTSVVRVVVAVQGFADGGSSCEEGWREV